MTGFSGMDVQAWIGWLATYAFHSTLLLGGAFLLARRMASDAWRETAWRAALVGGLITATVQSGTTAPPLAGRWSLRLPAEALGPAPVSGGPAAVRAAEPTGADVRGGDRLPRDDGAAGPTREPVPSGAPEAPRRAEGAVPASDPSAPGRTGGGLGWLLFAWAVGALLFTGRIVRHHLRLARMLRGRRSVHEPGVLRILEELRRSGGVSRGVRLTASELCPTPLALGGREICVPERLLSLDEEQQRSALAHELAHLARRDPEWHLAAAVVEAVFFFQPLNRCARRALREAAEHQCDDWAVRQTGSPLGLARCLMEVAAWVGADRRLPKEVPAMAQGGSPLVRRVERLLRAGPGPEPPRGSARAGTAAALVALTAVAAPAISSTADAPVGRGIVSRAAPAAGALPRLSPAQEEVIAHPSPAAPLEEKWAWAEREADRRGHRERWVAWAFDRLLPAGTQIVEDSHGWHTDEWSREPLGRLLFGPGFRAPREERSPARRPVVVLLHLRGDAIDRVAVRTAALGMDLRGDPIYWLGPTPQAQSFDWLAARADRAGSPALEGAMVEAIALHEESERVVAFLEGVIGSRRAASVRGEAVEGLAWHATDRSVRVLREVALGGAHELDLRVEAAETLGEVEAPAAEAVLLEVVASVAPSDVRVEAVEALGERPTESATAALARIAAEDPSEEIQEEAVETLGEVDPARAERLLEDLFRDRAAAVRLRREALDALAERRTPRALELVFQAALGDPSAEIQAEAVEALAEFPPEEAAPRLERIIWEHPRSEVRTEAVERAAELPEEIAVRILDRVLREHGDAAVVHEAVDALEDLPEAVALPLLIRAAREHPRSDVREEAREKLGETVGRRVP